MAIVRPPKCINRFKFNEYTNPANGRVRRVSEAHHSDEDFIDILMMDPGDSPADAIGFYSEQYVVLPISGEWFMYADRAWDGGTGVLTGPPDVTTFARESFAFYENPD